jgi:hypothetical protein
MTGFTLFYVNGGTIYEEGTPCSDESFAYDGPSDIYAPEENTQFTALAGSGFRRHSASISFSRDGYVLKEWNTNSDGTGTSVAPGELVEQLLTYYAIWEVSDPVPYIATDQELKSIADAIRTKGGTSAQLQFPTGFISAIEAISTGITPTGTKQINITENGTKTEDVTNYASAQITVAIPVYAGEIVIPTFYYEVTVSLTNPSHPEDFSSVGIYEMRDSNTVGNTLGLIDSATGSITIDVDPSLYGLKIVFSAISGDAYYHTSNISTTGDISLTSPSGSGLETKPLIFSVNSDGTITIDGIDWDF